MPRQSPLSLIHLVSEPSRLFFVPIRWVAPLERIDKPAVPERGDTVFRVQVFPVRAVHHEKRIIDCREMDKRDFATRSHTGADVEAEVNQIFEVGINACQPRERMQILFPMPSFALSQATGISNLLSKPVHPAFLIGSFHRMSVVMLTYPRHRLLRWDTSEHSHTGKDSARAAQTLLAPNFNVLTRLGTLESYADLVNRMLR
jgi:hypothetical protein